MLELDGKPPKEFEIVLIEKNSDNKLRTLQCT